MSENKHTPGKWSIENNDLHINIISDRQMQRIAHVYRWSDNQYDANAKLIASAPELLEENERLKADNAKLVEALKTSIGHPITKEDLARKWNDDFDLFPLPICLDPQEEHRELYHRGQMIERKAEEALQSIDNKNTL